MRLGGPVFDTMHDPQTLVDYHRKFGFSAAYVPRMDDPVKLAEIRAAFAEANILALAEIVIHERFWHNNLSINRKT